MNYFNLGIIILLQALAVFSTTNLTTLRHVQVIFRHGARTIDKTYPLDPYKNESYWPPGISQLTNLGKLQGYNLGLYLRQRYNGFIKDTYDEREVYLRSSDINRAIQTTYAVTSGFYLPNDILKNDNETMDDLVKSTNEIPLPWKSVPVHTVPVELDNVLRQKPEICPRYQKLLKECTEESEAAKRMTEENKDLFEYFSNNTGLNITSPIQFDGFYDALVIENYYNMTLPEWTKPVYGTEEVTAIALFYFQYLTYTYEMKRLRVGPLLQELVKNMNESVKGVASNSEKEYFYKDPKKMYFYSGHDHCISGVLDTLGIYDKKRPPFTSVLLLELHQERDSQEVYVEIHYRNETDRDAFKLELPACGEPCHLAEFVKLVDPFMPQDWNRECQILSEGNELSSGWIILTVLIFWVILFVGLQCWIRAKCCGRKSRHQAYSPLVEQYM